MKITFIQSIADIPWDEHVPVALEEHRGKTARVKDGYGNRSLMLILPCGHTASLFGWTIENIDTDEPTARPSILCRGKLTPEGQPSDCWHGWLTKGDLHT